MIQSPTHLKGTFALACCLSAGVLGYALADPYADVVVEDGVADDTCIAPTYAIGDGYASTAVIVRDGQQVFVEYDCTGDTADALGPEDAVFARCNTTGSDCAGAVDAKKVKAADGFQSLGNEGFLTLGFEDNLCLVDEDTATLDLRIGEFGVGETFDVYVDGQFLAAVVTTSDCIDGGGGHFRCDLDVSGLGIEDFRNVKVVDGGDLLTSTNFGSDLDFVECLNSQEGCTPGFWKNHTDVWPNSTYSPEDDFDETFDVNYFDPDISLEDALKTGGGGVAVIARHGTAALLNAEDPYVDYPFTVDDVKAAVQSGAIDDLAAANESSEECPALQKME
jgi:hypothetical protein